MKDNIVVSIYSYLFPMCLLRKAILVFLFFNVILRLIERISSLYRGYLAAIYRPTPSQIEYNDEIKHIIV